MINEQIYDYDIFLGILGSRFGTKTPYAGSGTEEEFNIAYDKFKNKQLVDICMFFKNDNYILDDIQLDQLALVRNFKEKISNLGCYRVNFYELDFEAEINKLFTKILLEWETYENRIVHAAETINHIEEIESDEDMGYYDAIYKAISEINDSSKITNNFSKYLKKLNQDMISTTVKLQDTIEDKAKAKLINKLSDNMDLFSNKINQDMPNQKIHFDNSMKYFNVAAQIYIEDFTSGKSEMIDILNTFENNINSFSESLSAIENLSNIIDKFPRATTKLNKSKKKLISVLGDFSNHQKNLIQLLDASREKLKSLI